MPTSRYSLFLCLGLAAALSGSIANAADSEVVNQQFIEAIEARDAGDLFGAIEDLKRLLLIAPNRGRVRIELAVAYYRAALFDQAKEAAKQVLADPKTPEKVRKTVSLFLREVEAQEATLAASAKARHGFSGMVTLGIGQDDNVNAGPASDVIVIGGTELSLTPGSTERRDDFGSLNVRFNHSYQMPRPLDIGSRPVKGVWHSVFGLYRRNYQDISDFNLDVISLGTGPALLSRTDWRANLHFQVDYIRLDEQKLGIYSSFTPSYTLVRGKTEYTLNGQWLRRNFSAPANHGLEGSRYGLGFDIAHQFNNKLSTRVGVSYYRTDARDDFKANDEPAIFADLFYEPWKNGTAYVRANYKKNDYDSQEPLFAVGRDDEQKSITLGLSHSFYNGKVSEWSVNVSMTYTDNRSNVAIYDYDRNVVQAEVSRRF
jgi:hypothetical protein